MQWIELISPILVFVGVAGGWFMGRRRQQAEVESLSVAAGKIAVETLIATINPLKAEIGALKVEVAELKSLNSQLLEENTTLASSVRQLRRLVARVDDYPPYFADAQERISKQQEEEG